MPVSIMWRVERCPLYAAVEEWNSEIRREEKNWMEKGYLRDFTRGARKRGLPGWDLQLWIQSADTAIWMYGIYMKATGIALQLQGKFDKLQAPDGVCNFF